MADPVPLERDEQIRFVTWLEDRDIRVTAIPNSTYTTSHKQKALNRATGLRPGFPDLVVLIKPSQSHDGRGYLLLPEMKRVQGGKVSPNQRAWIAALNGLGCDQIESVVAHGEYLETWGPPDIASGGQQYCRWGPVIASMGTTGPVSGITY